jgi:hypothetical protein
MAMISANSNSDSAGLAPSAKCRLETMGPSDEAADLGKSLSLQSAPPARGGRRQTFTLDETAHIFL